MSRHCALWACLIVLVAEEAWKRRIFLNNLHLPFPLVEIYGVWLQLTCFAETTHGSKARISHVIACKLCVD